MWRSERAQCENTKHKLLLFSYGYIICRHLQIWYLLYEHTLIINVWIVSVFYDSICDSTL